MLIRSNKASSKVTFTPLKNANNQEFCFSWGEYNEAKNWVWCRIKMNRVNKQKNYDEEIKSRRNVSWVLKSQQLAEVEKIIDEKPDSISNNSKHMEEDELASSNSAISEHSEESSNNSKHIEEDELEFCNSVISEHNEENSNINIVDQIWKDPNDRDKSPSLIDISEHNESSDKSNEESVDAYETTNENIDLYRTAGIVNENQDCFVNVGLQCLFCVPEFVQFFVNREYLDHENSHDSLSIEKYTDDLAHDIINEPEICNTSESMNATEYKYCEAMHEICHSLAIGDSDPIMNNAIRDLVNAYFPKGIQDDVLLFILHLFAKLQEEQTSKLSSFKSDDYENFDDALGAVWYCIKNSTSEKSNKHMNTL